MYMFGKEHNYVRLLRNRSVWKETSGETLPNAGTGAGGAD